MTSAPPEGLSAPAGVRVDAAAPTSAERVLTPGALAFAAALERRFRDRRAALLAARRVVQSRLDGGWRPGFLAETRAVRESEWRVAPPRPDLLDRRVEITGPVERKLVINALNSGANVFMADFEDANSPTFENCVNGQENLIDAVRRTIEFRAGCSTTPRSRTRPPLRPRNVRRMAQT